MRYYQIFNKSEDGSILFNKDKYEQLLKNLLPGRYLVSFQRLDPKSTLKDYRAAYFAKIDALASELGDTRYSTHEDVKRELFEKMVEETPELFICALPMCSTKYLTLEGWQAFIQRLDIWAFINHNIILQ